MKNRIISLVVFLIATSSFCSAQSFDLVPYRVKDKWGFADSTGKVKIKPQYQDVIPFNKGYAAYKKNDKWGVIDVKGKEIDAPQYDSVKLYFAQAYGLNELSERVPSVLFLNAYKDGQLLFIGTDGKKLDVDNERLIVSDVMMVVDNSMEITDISMFGGKKSITIYNKNGKYGFINERTREEYSAVYDTLRFVIVSGFFDDENGYLIACKDGLYGVIDKNNEVLVDFQYQSIRESSLDNKRLIVQKNKLYSIISSIGEPLLNEWFGSIREETGMYIAKLHDAYGAYSAKLKMILPHEFSEIESDTYGCGLYYIDTMGKMGHINCSYDKIVNPQYEWISVYNNHSSYNNFFIFRENGLFGYEFTDEFPSGNKYVIVAKYKKIEPFSGLNKYKYTTVTTQSGKKGYIRRDGLEFFKN
jgi:uncharacterized protein YkvS